MKDLEGRFDDQIAKNETDLEIANKKLSETMDLFDNLENLDDLKFQKLVNNINEVKAGNKEMEDAGYRWDDEKDKWVLKETEYDKAVKEQIEKEKKKGIFTLIEGGKDDDWSPPGLAGGGGIKFRPPRMHDKGLIKSLLNLGTTMGFSPKELLITFSKAGYEVTDELKKKFGVTDDDLAKESVGLEWLILKDNPNLAKQPYSESKVNKMLSEEFPTIQGDLFKKKTGGLINLIS
jgi:hypothetical protein